MILMIDNYDSFTYNIVQYLQMLGQEVKTVRNNEITLKEIESLQPTHIVISPGPGTPVDAGISIPAIKHFAGKIPILGVCLGHQAIIEAFGGVIIGAPTIVHGKTDTLEHDERGVFRNIKQAVTVVRYHSLVGDPARIPDSLEISAYANRDKAIMGIRHKKYQIEGVQFHPESMSTEDGLKMLSNFLNYRRDGSKKINLLKKISLGETLTNAEAITLMDEITDGELTDAQLGAFLAVYAVKGITPDELSGFVTVMRKKTGITVKQKNSLDIVGTGGDGKHSFNISSAAALVCASLGITVAKHGNRAISSSSGSYDFLQALKIKTDGKLEENLASLKAKKFAFFFAPIYHPAMKHVARVRQEVKFRTVFNLLGPLSNPLQVDHQIVGVYDEKLLDLFVQTLKQLGLKRVLVVHSKSGMDEISISGKTLVRELTAKGTIKKYEIDPKEFGVKGLKEDDLIGGNPQHNVDMFKSVLTNGLKSKQDEAVAAAIALNAGAGLYVMGKTKTIKAGYSLVQKALTDGTVKKYLEA